MGVLLRMFLAGVAVGATITFVTIYILAVIQEYKIRKAYNAKFKPKGTVL